MEPVIKELSNVMPDVIIKWKSFELRPDPVPTLDPNGEYLTNVWRDHVYPISEKMNMPLRKPPIQPRSRLAHEAAKWAGTQERFAEFNWELFSAFLEFGRDIGDIDILVKIAIDLGFEGQALRASLEKGEYTTQVVEDEEEAVRVGVRAVPAFIVDNEVIAAGLQPLPRLQELLSRAGNRTTGIGI